MSLVQRRPVIGPDCSKCPAPLTHSDDVMTHPLIGCCLFRPEGGASVSPVQEEAEPEESSANPSQGKRSRKHKKRKSDGERSYWRTEVSSRPLNSSVWLCSLSQLLKRRRRPSSTFLGFGSERSAANRDPRSAQASPTANQKTALNSWRPACRLWLPVTSCDLSLRGRSSERFKGAEVTEPFPVCVCAWVSESILPRFPRTFPYFNCWRVLQVYLFLVRVCSSLVPSDFQWEKKKWRVKECLMMSSRMSCSNPCIFL